MTSRSHLAAAMFAAAAVGGCVSTAAQPQRPLPPITCKKGSDCDMKWSRAVTWVSRNAGYKIQTQTDALIQTFGPVGDDTELAVTVNKTMVSPNSYEIAAKMSCGNMLGCLPQPYNALRQFISFVDAPAGTKG